MAAAEGVGGVEGGEAVGELAEGAAEAVVGGVVGGVLDGVAAEDGGVAVGVVGLVGGEVDLAEELVPGRNVSCGGEELGTGAGEDVLVVLELAHHPDGV